MSAGALSPGATSLLRESYRQRGASVQATSLFTGVIVLWPLFAVAHRLQAIGADAVRRQVLAHRGRAALAERQVVFSRADVAGVALERQSQRGVLFHRRHRLLK